MNFAVVLLAVLVLRPLRFVQTQKSAPVRSLLS